MNNNNVNGLCEAIKTAQAWLDAGRKYDTCGITEGQILRLVNGRLEMQPCWFQIDINADPRIVFRPLLPHAELRLFTDIILDEDFLNFLSRKIHAVGGRTVRCRNLFHGDTLFNVNHNKPIEPQIRQHENVFITAGLKQRVFEDFDSSLILASKTFLQLPDPINSGMDRFGCFFKEYRGVPMWSEPSREHELRDPKKPIPEEGIEPEEFYDYFYGSDYEGVAESSCDTGFLATLVPTLWLEDEKRGWGEFFLDFAGTWKQSKYGDKVSTRVGKFVLSHQIQHGKIITKTSLRESDSIFYQTHTQKSTG